MGRGARDGQGEAAGGAAGRGRRDRAGSGHGHRWRRPHGEDRRVVVVPGPVLRVVVRALRGAPDRRPNSQPRAQSRMAAIRSLVTGSHWRAAIASASASRTSTSCS